MSNLYLKTLKAAEDISSIHLAISNKKMDDIESNGKIEKVSISSRRIQKMTSILQTKENEDDDVSKQIFDVLKSILE